MATTRDTKPSSLKVQEHRQRPRDRGMRPIQVWVPDIRSPAFQAEAHQQSASVAASAQAREDQAFIDAVSDWAG